MSNVVQSIFCSSLVLGAGLCPCHAAGQEPAVRMIRPVKTNLTPQKIVVIFGNQGFRLNDAEAKKIQTNVQLAMDEAQKHGIGNSKVDFAAIEIAKELNVGTDNETLRRIVAAIGELSPPPPAQKNPTLVRPIKPVRPVRPQPITPSFDDTWEAFFEDTVNLSRRPDFANLIRQNQFSPVKISWEDIGRNQNSSWGDRISDVGIWVRKYENDPQSARLALSVRRDNNFRDKVLVVPAEKIKIHQKQGDKTIEKTLPQRLKELGLSSPTRDKNVIVSNQFAIVPVPVAGRSGSLTDLTPDVIRPKTGDTAPRVAFNFSIYPYGSTNYVITDVIEGSSEAIVGRGNHQLLFANIDGQKAPFTASRAREREDLLQLERELKSQGMDVDVQRYYLIQIPLKSDAKVTLSNMGTPPREATVAPPMVQYPKPYPIIRKPHLIQPLDTIQGGVQAEPQVMRERMELKLDEIALAERIDPSPSPALARVAIGHGEAEGPYSGGSGYKGARADEPIRVTVVYFVTPLGEVTEADTENFVRTFSQWDEQAIWGGSFVTKE